MSDLHSLPLRGHDLPHKPVVRAKVYSYTSKITGGTSWYWKYTSDYGNTITHGPFYNWREAFDSAWRMVEAL